jgi:hypothetical protein
VIEQLGEKPFLRRQNVRAMSFVHPMPNELLQGCFGWLIGRWISTVAKDQVEIVVWWGLSGALDKRGARLGRVQSSEIIEVVFVEHDHGDRSFGNQGYILR